MADASLLKMRWAAILARVAAGNLDTLSTADVFHAATVGGATALLRDDIGRLASGMKADIVLADITIPEMMPARDPLRGMVYTAADRAVLRATDEVLGSGAVSPATWALCEESLGSDEERVELVIAIGTWNLISQFLRSLDVPLEKGVMAWPPDGKSPPKARSGNGGALA